MCGIIGYIGEKEAQPILVEGLRRLEYRGYDSSGVAISDGSALSIRKRPGKLAALITELAEVPLAGSLGIGHTRWATHGAPTQTNAHPHMDCKKEIAVVHNGIVENYQELKDELIKKGHRFESETDTEVLAHLIEENFNGNNLEEAVREAVRRTSEGGGYDAICVICKNETQKLIGARYGSPLVVGLGKGENYIASDVSALLEHTRDVIYLGEGEVATLTKGGCRITDLKGREVKKEASKVTWDISQAQKNGEEHFMIKEIKEQPRVVEQVLAERIKSDNTIDLGIDEGLLKGKDNVLIIACGTAYHAGLVGKYLIEEFAKLSAWADISSEFRYRSPIIGERTLVIPISQSGETADTLASLRLAKEKGATIVSICNVVGSSVARESDGVIYTHAGPEISVASTKAYIAQLVTLFLLAIRTGEINGIKTTVEGKAQWIKELREVPRLLREILDGQVAKIKEIARLYPDNKKEQWRFFYIGRNINYPSALEGALKLKEISYIHAEGYPAGEMKHGPIALVEDRFTTVSIATESKVYKKVISNMQEIKARQGKMIAIATEGDEAIMEHAERVIYIPRIHELLSPVLITLPLQLIAYYIAKENKCSIDQPRNLAKSVTVE